MADRNTELRQLKEMLNEAKQIENLKKRYRDISNNQPEIKHNSDTPYTFNVDKIQNQIKKEQDKIPEFPSLHLAIILHAILSIASIVAMILVTNMIFSSADGYAKTMTFWGDAFSTAHYIMYLICISLIALVISYLSSPFFRRYCYDEGIIPNIDFSDLSFWAKFFIIVIILSLISNSIATSICLPSVLFGLILLAAPIISCILLMLFLVIPAEKNAERRRNAIIDNYASALIAAKEEDARIRETTQQLNHKKLLDYQKRLRTERAPIEAELRVHNARLNEINVIGTNPKTVEYLQTLIGYMEGMRADSIKEAINLEITEKRINEQEKRIREQELIRQHNELLRSMENRRYQEQLLDEARRTRRAEEARAAEAKKASDSLDKIQRDLDYELTYGKRP